MITRPKTLNGLTTRYRTGCGWVYVTVNSLDGKIVEVFARTGKSGGCGGAFLESLGRTLSVALRSGADPEEIAKQYDDVKCYGQGWDEGEQVNCVTAIAKAIRFALDENRMDSNGNTN